MEEVMLSPRCFLILSRILLLAGLGIGLTAPATAEQPGKESETVSKLIAQLKDRNARVRAEAAQALGKMGPPAQAAALPLLDLVNDRDNDVQRKASHALSAIVVNKQMAIPFF